MVPATEEPSGWRKARNEINYTLTNRFFDQLLHAVPITRVLLFKFWFGNVSAGNSVYQFLQKVLELLRREFSELKTVMADQLMYVKEDLILPHHYTFYDFIVTKARGKSGPLFQFDAHDDVRLLSDASVEKEESHAGKVLMRSWYERNKHIFPASRWEPYDPTKVYDKYTVSDKIKKQWLCDVVIFISAKCKSINYLRCFYFGGRYLREIWTRPPSSRTRVRAGVSP